MKLNYGFAPVNVQNLVVTLNALYLAGYPPLTDLSSVSYFGRFKPLILMSASGGEADIGQSLYRPNGTRGQFFRFFL